MKPYLYSLPASILLCGVLSINSAFADQGPPEGGLDPARAEVQAEAMPQAQEQEKELVYGIAPGQGEKGGEPARTEVQTAPPTAKGEPSPEEKVIEILKDASGPQGKGTSEPKVSKPGKPAGNPKDRQISYNKDSDSFRAHIEAPEWQRAHSDRRSFGAFARNYTNRIHCDGVISDVIYPTTKGLELELKNGGHDLFIQVGPSVPSDITYFPADLNIVCQGEVFQINAVMDSQYAGTNMELTLSGETPREALKPYEDAIIRAQGLPHEEQLVKILIRVWNHEYLPYWKTKKQNRSCGFGSSCKLGVSIDTGISGIAAWDFLAPIDASIPELLARLGQYVTGEIIGIGRVPLREAQRVIILSVKKAGAKR